MFIRNTRRAQALIQNGIHCFAGKEGGGGEGGEGGSGSGEEGEGGADVEKLKATISDLQSKVGKLTEHNEKLFAERKRDQEKAAEAAEEAKKAAAKAGDVKALEESWQAKYDKREAELLEKVGSLEGNVAKLTSGQAASTIAGELAVEGSAKALLPHISGRLTTEYVDGDPVVRVLDADGKPSAASLDDLKAELKADKALAPLIVGSKASGAGGSDNSAAGGGVTIKKADFDAKTAKERAKFMKDNPDAQIVN